MMDESKTIREMYQTQSSLGYSPRDTRYLLAKEVLSPMKKYCLEKNVRTMQDLVSTLQKENSSSFWLKILDSDFAPADVSVRTEMMLWFREKEKENARNRNVKRKPSRACVCTDTGEEFSSFQAAARRYGASATAVAGCCRGKIESARGYHFAFKTNGAQ